MKKNVKNLTKRGFALFVALVMCLSTMPLTAFADDSHELEVTAGETLNLSEVGEGTWSTDSDLVRIEDDILYAGDTAGSAKIYQTVTLETAVETSEQNDDAESEASDVSGSASETAAEPSGETAAPTTVPVEESKEVSDEKGNNYVADENGDLHEVTEIEIPAETPAEAGGEEGADTTAESETNGETAANVSIETNVEEDPSFVYDEEEEIYTSTDEGDGSSYVIEENGNGDSQIVEAPAVSETPTVTEEAEPAVETEPEVETETIEWTVTVMEKASKTETATMEATAEDGAVITVSGNLPADGSVTAEKVDIELEGKRVLAAYDITILDASEEVFEPEEGTISVSIALPELADVAEVEVYHFPGTTAADAPDITIDDLTPETLVDTIDVPDDSVAFDLGSLSLVVITSDSGETSDTLTIDNINYQLYDDGHAVVTGNTFGTVTKQEVDITIPATVSYAVEEDAEPAVYTVTEIGENAFYNLQSYSKVTLPESLETIGDYAFYKVYLTGGTFTIPDSVTSIGESAFRSANWASHYLGVGNGITKIIIGDGVTEISTYAFYSNNYGDDVEVEIGSNVTSIASNAWASGDVSSVTVRGNYSADYDTVLRTVAGFAGVSIAYDDVTTNACTVDNITYQLHDDGHAVVIGGSITTSTKATNVTIEIPAAVTCNDTEYRVTEIAAKAFYNLQGNAQVILHEGLETIGDYAFYKVYLTGGTFTIPDSVTSIGVGAFQYCSWASWSGYLGTGNGITKIVIGDGVTTIPLYAFYSNNFGDDVEVEISSNVTKIDEYAWAYDDASESGDVSSVTVRGEYSADVAIAIAKCKGLANVPVTYTETDAVDVPAIAAVENQIYNLYTDGGTYTATLVKGKTINNAYVVPETITVNEVEYTVTAVGDKAFARGFNSIDSVSLPDTLTSIGAYAFAYGYTSSEVKIPDSVTEVGEGAFQGDAFFTKTLYTGNGVTSLPANFFTDSSAYDDTIIIGASVTEIDPAAFAGCKNLTVKINQMEGSLDDVIATVPELKNAKSITYIGAEEDAIESATLQDMIDNPTKYADEGVTVGAEDGTITIALNSGVTFKDYGTVTISAGKNVVLTNAEGTSVLLNGNTLISTMFKVESGATLTIQANGGDGMLTLKGGTVDAKYTGTIATVYGTLNLESGTINGGTAGSNTMFTGAVVLYNSGAEFNMSGGVIQKTIINGSSCSAAVVVGPSTTFNMTGGSIRNNTQNGSGQACASGGVAVWTWGVGVATFNMSGGEITGNTSKSGGGGVGIIGGGAMYMNGGVISDNTTSVMGGGICVYGSGDGTQANGYDRSVFVMNGGEITGNEVTGYANAVDTSSGGGIYVNSNYVTLNAGTISNNKAANHGGGVYVSTSEYTLHASNMLVTGNTASSQGGGLWFCPSGSGTLYAKDGYAAFGNTSGGVGDDIVATYQTNPMGIGEDSSVTLSERMLGGGLNEYYVDGGTTTALMGCLPGINSGVARYNAENPVRYTGENTSSFSVKNVPSENAKALAQSKATLFITGNTAAHGGGVATNGFIIVGDPAVDVMKFSIDVKKVWDGIPENEWVPITIALVIDGYRLDTITLSAENEWSGSFTGLPSELKDRVSIVEVTTGYAVQYTWDASGCVIEDLSKILENLLGQSVIGGGGDEGNDDTATIESIVSKAESATEAVNAVKDAVLNAGGSAEVSLVTGSSKLNVKLDADSFFGDEVTEDEQKCAVVNAVVIVKPSTGTGSDVSVDGDEAVAISVQNDALNSADKVYLGAVRLTYSSWSAELDDFPDNWDNCEVSVYVFAGGGNTGTLVTAVFETGDGAGTVTITGTEDSSIVSVIVTNSMIVNPPTTTSVSVGKVWQNENGEVIDAPEGIESILVQLYRDGEAYGDPIELNAENGWTVTVSNLPVGDWTVEEITALEGFESPEYQHEEGSAEWTIINQLSPEEPDTPGGGDDESNDPEPTPTPSNPSTPSTPDTPDTPEDIPDEDVPLADVPEPDVPQADVPDADVPQADVPEPDVPLVDVPDEDVPLVDVPDEDVPQTDIPDEDIPLTDIPEPDVPQSDVPQTGDNFAIWFVMLLLSGFGLAWLTLTSKKRVK